MRKLSPSTGLDAARGRPRRGHRRSRARGRTPATRTTRRGSGSTCVWSAGCTRTWCWSSSACSSPCSWGSGSSTPPRCPPRGLDPRRAHRGSGRHRLHAVLHRAARRPGRAAHAGRVAAGGRDDPVPALSLRERALSSDVNERVEGDRDEEQREVRFEPWNSRIGLSSAPVDAAVGPGPEPVGLDEERRRPARRRRPGRPARCRRPATAAASVATITQL